MRRGNSLYLHEEIMLLALRDREGTVFSGTHVQLRDRGGRPGRAPDGEADRRRSRQERRIRQGPEPGAGRRPPDRRMPRPSSRGRRGATSSRPGSRSSPKRKTSNTGWRSSLVRRGILRIDEDKVLGIFTRKIYPEIDPGPERELIERLRQAIFGDIGEVDPRTAVLLSLAKSADLLKLVFEKKQLKGRKARIEQVVNGEMTGKATQEAIQAVQAAILVACIMPAIIASTTAAH